MAGATRLVSLATALDSKVPHIPAGPLKGLLIAPQALASVQAMFPERKKPLALGIYGAIFGLAAVVGQALGGVLISLDLMGLGWRAIFLINLPVALLDLLFGIPLLKETRARDARRLDLGGMALSMLTRGALLVPLIEGRS